jgi:dTDP-4-dehydrorhamnose reductase
MRVLVVGGAGQVGRNLVRIYLRDGHWVGATYKARRPPPEVRAAEVLDKSNPSDCDAVVERIHPDVVIDTGALHNVDYCEAHPDEANAVNRDGTRFLAQACHRIGAKFVFVSTDFVFDGSASTPYSEGISPHPQSEYARSKFEGEVATLATSPGNLVVRPSVIYSWLDTRERSESSSGKGLNFGTWLIEEVGAGRPVRIINDQVASPTLAEDLAGAIHALVNSGETGTFHAAGRSPMTRYDFSVRLVKELGLDTSMVKPVATRDLNQKAQRPVNSSLDSSKLESRTGYRTLAIEDAAKKFAADYRSDPGKS